MSWKEKLVIQKWDSLEKHARKRKTKIKIDVHGCKVCTCKEQAKVCNLETPHHGITSIQCGFKTQEIIKNLFLCFVVEQIDF
jgi:hypothetical protein